jgi:hypothetical protein
LRADLALPSSVRGPVDAFAFSRLASICASVAMTLFPFGVFVRNDVRKKKRPAWRPAFGSKRAEEALLLFPVEG